MKKIITLFGCLPVRVMTRRRLRPVLIVRGRLLQSGQGGQRGRQVGPRLQVEAAQPHGAKGRAAALA